MSTLDRYLGCVLALLLTVAAPLIGLLALFFGIICAVVVVTCGLGAIAGPTGFGACLAGSLVNLTALAIAMGGVAGAIFALTLGYALIACALQTPAPVGGAAPSPVGGQLGGPAPIDCPSAQAMLAAARTALDAAEAAEDAARAAARRAERRLRNAQAAFAAAGLAVAGSVLAPWLLPGALAALAAASVLVARRVAASVAAQAALSAAQLALARAFADVAAAEALVLALCAPPATPGGRDPVLTGGVLLAGATPRALSLGAPDCGCHPPEKR